MPNRIRVAKIRAGARSGGVPGLEAGMQLSQSPLGQRSGGMQTLIGDILKRRIADEQFERNIAQATWLQRMVGEKSEALANQKYGRDLSNEALKKLGENPQLKKLYDVARQSIPGWDDLPIEGRIASFPFIPTEELKITPELLGELSSVIELEGRGQIASETGAQPPPFDVNSFKEYSSNINSRRPPTLKTDKTVMEFLIKRLGKVVKE